MCKVGLENKECNHGRLAGGAIRRLEQPARDRAHAHRFEVPWRADVAARVGPGRTIRNSADRYEFATSLDLVSFPLISLRR